jgi:hypothetical protein
MMRKLITMREALESRLYFADLIGDPSWAAWRVLLPQGRAISLRPRPVSAKTGHSATAGRCIKSTFSSPWSKASGFETRILAAILAADIVGRLTGADKDRTLWPRY